MEFSQQALRDGNYAQPEARIDFHLSIIFEKLYFFQPYFRPTLTIHIILITLGSSSYKKILTHTLSRPLLYIL